MAPCGHGSHACVPIGRANRPFFSTLNPKTTGPSSIRRSANSYPGTRLASQQACASRHCITIRSAVVGIDFRDLRASTRVDAWGGEDGWTSIFAVVALDVQIAAGSVVAAAEVCG